MKIGKKLISKLSKSSFKTSDAWSLLVSFCLYPKNVIVSGSYKFVNKGEVNASGVTFIGVFSNRLGLNRRAGGQFSVTKGGKVDFGTDVRIARGCNIFVNKSLIIGNNTSIQAHSQIVANESVIIGSNYMLSWNLQILDDDLHQIVINNELKTQKAAIVIGNNVWVGCNTIILKGTLIGDNCIVAAGSVVKGVFLPGSLIGGIPAKVIKENANWM